MKIAFVSTHSNPCPPPNYGGESYYWELAKNLGLRGHQVTLFAPGGSLTPPNGRLRLIEGSPMSYTAYRGGDPFSQAWGDKEKEQNVAKMYEKEFLEADIIHDCSHQHLVAEYFRNYHHKTNIVNTINGNVWLHPREPFNMVVGSQSWLNSALRGLHGFEGTRFEESMKGAYVGEPFKDARVIYWGVDTDFYKPSDYKKEDYFLWISRFHPTKGTDIALKIAKDTGIKLILAGSIDVGDHHLYAQKYFDMMKSIPNATFFNNPKDSGHHERKRELYRKAKGFIFPLQVHEPFGLVVAEALACGCPVITLNYGAMPEIVKDGKTGYVCGSVQEMVKRISDIDKIAPGDCVDDVNDRFNTKKLAIQYETLYTSVINGERW